MAVAYLKQPRVYNPGLQISNIYARSAFRPYAGLFQGSRSTATDLLDQQIIKAISSPFSINDQNVINAIRRQHGIVDDGSYQMSRQIGGVVGAIAGVGISAWLYKGAVASALTMNPVGMGVALGLVGLGVIGTIFTSMHLGEAIGASIGSKEGQIAGTQYLTNLGNSLVRRPIGTVLKTATMIAVPIATAKLGIKSPYLTQGITMLAMRGVSWVGDLADNAAFGEMSEQDAMSYTDLMALYGDLADNLSGSSILKAIAASIPNQDNFSNLLAKAYGVHEEGFDPLDFNDVREAFGVDWGTFGNMAIDILGEILIDADNLGGAIKRSYEKKILDPVKKQLKNDPDFKDLNDKQVERIAKEILKDYKIAKKGMSLEEVRLIELENKLLIEKVIHPFLVQELKKGYAEKTLDDNLKTKDKFEKLKTKIEESFKVMIGDIEGVFTTLGEIGKKVNEHKDKLNPDVALLKDMELGKYNPDSKRIRDLYNSYNTFRLYSDANDLQMQVISYFTKPFQSIYRSKFVQRKMNQVLTKIKNYYDPIKKVTDEIEGTLTTEDIKKQKEKYAEYEKKSREYIDKLKREAIQKKILKEAAKKNPKYTNFETIEAELKKLKDQLKDAEGDNLKALEEQIKPLQKQFDEMQNKLLADWNKTRLARRIKEIEEKFIHLYRDLKALENYGKNVEYRYYSDGQEVRRSIHDEKTLEEAYKVIEVLDKELLNPKTNRSRESILKEKEIIESKIKEYEAQEQFRSQNTELIRLYSYIYKILETYEIQYAIIYDAFVRLQKGYNKIQYEIKKAKKSVVGDATQDEFAENIKDTEKILKFKMEEAKPTLEEVAKNLGLPENIVKKMIKQITEEKLKFRMHPASTVFDVLKDLITENDFFNSKPALFDALNKLFLLKEKTIIVSEGEKPKSLIEVLQNIVTDKNGKIRNTSQKEYLAAATYISEFINKQSKEEYNGSLSDDEIDHINKNIIRIIQSWVHLAKTNKVEFEKQLKDESHKKNKYFDNIYFVQDFFLLKKTNMQNLVLSFVANNLMTDVSLKEIDENLEIIQSLTKKQIEFYQQSNSPTEKGIVEQIRRRMFQLKNSKLLYAINSRFNKKGILSELFHSNDINLNTFNFSEIDSILGDIRDLEIKVFDVQRAFEEYIKELNTDETREEFEAIEKRLKEFYEIKNMSKTSLTEKDKDIFDVIKNLLEIKDVDTSDPKLNNERFYEFVKKVYDLHSQLKKRKNDMKAAVSKNLQIRKDIKSKNQLNPMLRFQLENDILALTNPSDVSYNRRGQNKKASDHKIDMEKFDGNLLQTYMNNIEGEITAHDVRLLILKSSNNKFVNRNGVEVELKSIYQIPFEYIPNNWVDAMHKPYEATEENAAFLEFFKGQNKNEEGKYDEYQKRMVDTPYQIRDAFENKRTEKQKEFDRVEEIKLNEDGKLEISEPDLIGDLEKQFLHRFFKQSDQIESIEILYSEKNGDNKYKFVIDDGSGKESEVMVVRIQQSGDNGKLLQYYIPIATKHQLGVQGTETQKEQIREYETYKIGGETYLRRKIYKNETVIREVFDDIFQSDLNRLNDEHFKPLLSNRSIFHTYYGNEPILGTNENFSNLMWLDPNRTDMADIILSGAEYLTQRQLQSLYENPKEFIEMLDKEGYDVEISQSNVTFVTKRPLVYDGKGYKALSFLRLYNVGFDKIENPGRHGIGTMNAKNAKKYVNEKGEYEKPYLQNSLFEYKENKWLEERGGFNAITALVNMNFRFKNGDTLFEILKKNGYGATTFEDGAIMSESAFLKYYGYNPDQRRPVKIVDRYSNKGSVTVVPDKIMKRYAKEVGLEEVPEVLLSEHGTEKRNLYATLFELQNTRHLIGQKDKKTVYVDHGKLTHNTIETDIEEKNKYGYLYLYKMEIGDGKSKATKGYDTITRDSMSISHEDLQVLSSLPYIKDSSGKAIDEEGILFDEIKKVAKTYQPSQDYELTGKNSITAEQFRWHLPYSNSMVIRNNSRLKPNQISVPVHVLVEMGLGFIHEETGKYIPNKIQGSNEVLIMRRPTKGRESIVYAKIVPSYYKYDYAIGIPASMTAAPNADFDYDNMQFFAMVGFSNKAREIAKRAFSHHYTNDSDKFNDMDEDTMKKYNMDKKEEDIILHKDNNLKVDIRKEFRELTEEELATWNFEILEKTIFVKHETPRVRDYVDVLYDRFYTNTNPDEDKDSNVLFDKFLWNEKNKGYEEYKDLLSSESIVNNYPDLNLRIVRVQSFEHLRRMILDSTTQLTVNFGKHGEPWMKSALRKVTEVLFHKDYIDRLDSQLQMASYIIPKFYAITMAKFDKSKLKEKGIDINKLMNEIIDEIIEDAKKAFKKNRLVIKEELINPADYNTKVIDENEKSSLAEESEKMIQNFIEAELKAKGVSEEEMKEYKEAVQSASDRKTFPTFTFDLTYNLKTMGTIVGLDHTDIRDQLQSITLRTKYEDEGKKGKTAFNILKGKLERFLLRILKDAVINKKIIYIEVDGKKILLEEIFKFKDNFLGGRVIRKETALTNMRGDNSARVSGEFNEKEFDFKKIKSFRLISDDYTTHRKINISLEKHWVNFQKEVENYLGIMGIDRRFSIRPDIQNGIIHKIGLVSNLLEDIYLGTNNSRIGMIIRETGKKNPSIKNKIKSLFKDFHLYQTVLSYLSGDVGESKAKRSNVVSEIALMENIFNNEIQIYTDYSKLDPTYTRTLLIQTGFLEKGEDIKEFYEKYNLRDKQDILDFLNVVAIIKENIHKTKFLRNMQTLKKYEDIASLMQRIIKLRRNGIQELGELFKQSDDRENLYTQNDLNLLKYDELGNDKIDDYLEIVYTISSVVGQKSRNAVLRDSLSKEIIEISDLKSITSLVTAELIRHSFTDAYYINQSSENGKFGVFQKDPAISDKMIIIKNNELNKYNKDVLSRWYKLVESYDITRVDSPLSNLRKEQRELRLAQDISTLMSLDKSSPLSFADAIYNEMNSTSRNTNVSNGLLKMLYLVNKIYGQINNNQPAIGVIELIGVLEKVKYERAEIIDPKTNEVRESHTGKAFSNYIRGLQQELLHTKGVNITDSLSEFEFFVGLETGFSYKMNRNPEPFVREIIGRIFYERNTAGSMFNKDESLPTREEFMDKILKDLEEVQTKNNELTNNTSYSLTRNILDGITTPEEITQNEKGIEEIKVKVEEYENRPRLEESSKKNVIDTYEIVSKSYRDELDRKITVFSLFNIYSEFSGFYKQIRKILNRKGLTYKQKEKAIQSFKSHHYKRLRDEIVARARETDPNFKFKGAPRLHAALIDSYINLKVVEHLANNIDKITDNESGVKDLLEKFKDPSQRKNFIIFDTENNISSSKVKKFYELSYIIFDDDGKPIFKQLFFPDTLNETTLRWLKEDKVWSDEDIAALEKEIGTSNFKKLKKELSEFVELIKNKTIIGQAVKGSEGQDGEIDKINALLEDLYAKDVQKVVDKYNEQDKEFLKLNEMPNEAEFKKILDDIKNPQHLKDFVKHLFVLERQRVNKLLGRTGEVIYHDAYKEYELKIATLLEVILETDEDSVIIESIKTLFDTTDEQATVIFNAYKTELQKITNEGIIREKVPKLIIEDGRVKWGYVEYDSLESYAIKEDPNSNFSRMLFKQNAFHMIRDTLRKTILVNQQQGYKHRMTLGQLEKYSYISPEFDTFVRESKNDPSKLSDNMRVLLDVLESQDPEVDLYGYLKAYHRARVQFESENNAKILEDANLFEDVGETLFGEKTIKINEDRLREVMLENPTISRQQFSRLVVEKINELEREILQKTKVEMDPILKTRINSIVYRANLFEFNDLDSEAEIKLLSKLLSLDIEETTKIYDEFKKRYLGYKDPDNKRGIKFSFFSGNEQEDGIFYDENIDYLFKEQALRDIIYKDGSTLRVHLEVQDELYKEYIQEHKPYESAYESEKEYLNDHVKSKVNEHETNKKIWSDAKLNLKNIILQSALSGDWKLLEDYIDKHPALNKDQKQKMLNDFKKKFNETFEHLKENGIDHRINEPYFNKETNRFEDFRPSGKKYEYIKGSRNVDIFFYKEVINHLEYEIYSMLYAEEMVTYKDVDPKTKKELSRSKGIVTWKEYHLNPQKFLFEYKEEQLDESYESMREALKSTNKHMVEKFNKIERLSTYQYRFFDLVGRFKRNGKWDIDGLWKEINEGYLGRNFVITAIKNFSEEEINLLTPKETMDPNTPPDLQHYIDSEDIKGMKDVSLKIINIKNKEALVRLIDYMESNKDALLGFTTKYDLLNINKINYSGYEMPKTGSKLYNVIVGYQKFIMLLNPGFILRNIMDAIQRNYALVFQNGIIEGPMDFIREGKRTIEIEHLYEKHLQVSIKSITEIKSFYDELKSEWSTPESIKMSIDSLRAKLDYQIENLTNYRNNILDINEDAKVIEIIDKAIEDLSIIKFEFDSKDLSNNKSRASDLAKQYAQAYMRMGFLSNIIAESDKMDFNDKSQENIQKIKDEIYFMNIINGIENSEIMSDRYKSRFKKDFYDAFEEEVESFVRQGILYQGLDKLYNSKYNFFGMFNDKVERWQRIHGVLLDMRVNGLTKIEAYNQSLRRFFNYGKRSNVEEAATAFFPFASFAIRNLDYTLEMLGNMKYMRMISNIMQGMRAMYNDHEEDNEFATPFYNFLIRSNGWIPITNNSSLKTSRALFEGMEIIDDPFGSAYQKTNPMIQQLNNLTYGKDFDMLKALGVNNNIFINAFKAIGNIATGNVNSPADIAPSIFFEDTFEKYTPKSTPTIYGDYRNLHRDLFFPNGARRVPSRNPYTTAKNILYKNWVNARLMAKYRRNDKFKASSYR